MKTKTKMLIDVVFPLCLGFGISFSIGYSVYRHQKAVNERIASDRLIKINGYVFEKLTIDGHEYLKFNNSVVHSGSCTCFQKTDVEAK